MMSVCFSDDELFTLGAALELAMTTCERDKEYGLADRFAELFKRVDEAVRGHEKLGSDVEKVGE